jgi:hypothetical protein
VHVVPDTANGMDDPLEVRYHGTTCSIEGLLKLRLYQWFTMLGAPHKVLEQPPVWHISPPPN